MKQDAYVSIHVPARGTTRFQLMSYLQYFCFNPRSREGNDSGKWPTPKKQDCFNPRSREGNDIDRLKPLPWICWDCFNPRSREGNDAYLPRVRPVYGEFQSTFPRGERPVLLVSSPYHSYCFNPRSREGNDSLHKKYISFGYRFNPRSREGNDLCCPSPLAIVVCFNPRSREGNDGDGKSVFHIFFLFQSTFPRGERHQPVGRPQRARAVSIHVPARGTTNAFNAEQTEKTFQSTFPRGERRISASKSVQAQAFQSTFPRGERLQTEGKHRNCYEFQSTFPRGERRRRPLNKPKA